MPDSPAQKAGLHNGDVLESIAGFTSSQMSVGQAQALLGGEPGASVKISVIRRSKPEPQEIDLTLAKTAAPRILEDKMQDDIAYLRVQGFDAGSAKQIREKLSQFDKQGAKKLILDLRDCSTGDAAEGISTAQIFVSSGTITTLKGQTVSTDVVAADAAKVTWKLPVSVLISNGTSGPAEIVASAIAGNHRGETVGERTFGTASVQKLIPLDDGSALILTVANYYTPDGKSIAAEGVAPTVEVNPYGDEAANSTDEEPNYPAPAGHAVSPTDPAVKKAIEILNGAGAPAARKAA